MTTFKVSSSGCTTGTFTIADSKISFEAVTEELNKLGVYDISDKQVKSIVETGYGVEFKFCKKARKAIPVTTIKDITEELRFHKALNIVNVYNNKKFELLNKVSIETVISITKKIDGIAAKYGIKRI